MSSQLFDSLHACHTANSLATLDSAGLRSTCATYVLAHIPSKHRSSFALPNTPKHSHNIPVCTHFFPSPKWQNMSHSGVSRIVAVVAKHVWLALWSVRQPLTSEGSSRFSTWV